MSLSKLSFQIWILSAFITASIHSPVRAQEPLTQGHEERDIGISLYNQGNTESAIKALGNAVRKDKFDLDAWYYLGLACNTSGDSKCAQKAFEEAVNLRPDFPEARTGLAYSLFRLGKMEEAVAQAESALNLNSGQEVAHYIIGSVRLQQNSYSAASQQADAALRLKPDYAPALLLKSQAAFLNYVTTSNLEVANSKRTAEVARQQSFAYLLEADSALEQYIRLQPNDKDINVWRDQLETIRTFSSEPSSDAQVFSPGDVTTKAIVKHKTEPQFTERARSNSITGTVVLRAIFAADGSVRGIRILKALPDGLTQVAIAAARRIEFIPAMKDGRTVSTYIQLEYNFNLF